MWNTEFFYLVKCNVFYLTLVQCTITKNNSEFFFAFCLHSHDYLISEAAVNFYPASYPTHRFSWELQAIVICVCVCFEVEAAVEREALSVKISLKLCLDIFEFCVFSWISEKRRSPGMSLWRHLACQHESDSELRCCSSDSAMRKGWFTGEAAHGSSDYAIQKGNWKGKMIIFQFPLFNFIQHIWISETLYPEIKAETHF